MNGKLTKAQRAMLEQYVGAGVTSQAFGRIDTWSALVRKRFLTRSYGPGAIHSEITEAGLRALSQSSAGA